MDAAVGGVLFPRLLGVDFERLPASVRTLHRHAGPRTWHGDVTVERGTGLLARWMAAATRLPPAGQGRVAVEIVPTAGGERWVRRIGGRAMPSRLWAEGRVLCEQLGLVRFGFKLAVEADAIVWRVASVRALGVPLPARWFAGVAAREYDLGGRYAFDVQARLPFAGLLVHYRGCLDAA